MGAVAIKDAGGSIVYLAVDGDGSAINPYRMRQSSYNPDGTSVATIGTGLIKVTGDGTLNNEFVIHVEAETTASVPASLVVNETNYKSVYLTNGGSNDMGVKGDVTPVTFDYKPAAGKKIIVGRMLLYMEDASAFDSVLFGSITALTNGVSVLVNGVEIENWKTNIDMVTTFYDAESHPTFSAANRSMICRWSFTKAAGNVEGLTILETDGIAIKIQDDLDGIDIFTAKIQGVEVDV